MIQSVTEAFLNRDDVPANKDKYDQHYEKDNNQISGSDDDTHNMDKDNYFYENGKDAKNKSRTITKMPEINIKASRCESNELMSGECKSDSKIMSGSQLPSIKKKVQNFLVGNVTMRRYIREILDSIINRYMKERNIPVVSANISQHNQAISRVIIKSNMKV